MAVCILRVAHSWRIRVNRHRHRPTTLDTCTLPLRHDDTGSGRTDCTRTVAYLRNNALRTLLLYQRIAYITATHHRCLHRQRTPDRFTGYDRPNGTRALPQLSRHLAFRTDRLYLQLPLPYLQATWDPFFSLPATLYFPVAGHLD